MLDDIKSDIKSININSLKSYGEKWEDSRANITVYVKEQNSQEFGEVKQFNFEGFHYSNMYYLIHLQNI